MAPASRRVKVDANQAPELTQQLLCHILWGKANHSQCSPKRWGSRPSSWWDWPRSAVAMTPRASWGGGRRGLAR